MYDQVIYSIQSFGPFTDQHLQLVRERLKLIVLEKDEFLVKENQICRAFYFIKKGGLRHFIVNEDGTESTLNLWLEDEWIFEYKSFVSQQPSLSAIQASEPSEVFSLGGHDFHELVKVSDSFFRMGRIFEQAIQNQDFQNNRLNPEEKYELLLVTKPQLLNKFPLKQIASYLGMTPETLSRIRKKISS